jgi:hypothetical protein
MQGFNRSLYGSDIKHEIISLHKRRESHNRQHTHHADSPDELPWKLQPALYNLHTSPRGIYVSENHLNPQLTMFAGVGPSDQRHEGSS